VGFFKKNHNFFFLGPTHPKKSEKREVQNQRKKMGDRSDPKGHSVENRDKHSAAGEVEGRRLQEALRAVDRDVERELADKANWKWGPLKKNPKGRYPMEPPEATTVASRPASPTPSVESPQVVGKKRRNPFIDDEAAGGGDDEDGEGDQQQGQGKYYAMTANFGCKDCEDWEPECGDQKAYEEAAYQKFVTKFHNRCETLVDMGTLVYAVVGEEVAETTGRRHLQMAVVYTRNRRFKAAVKDWKGCHVSKKYTGSSVEEFINYCKKEGKWVEFGEVPRSQGKATQDAWDEARSLAIEGRIDEVAGHIYVPHYSALKAIAKDHPKALADLNITAGCGVWYVGQAGAGKSRQARADYPNFYPKMPNKWWDGYQGVDQPIIIDDVDPKNAEYLGYHLKIWADRYPFLAETKGGGMKIRPSKVIVTSQYAIEDCWADEETRAAIKRRFEVRQVGAPKMAPIFRTPPERPSTPAPPLAPRPSQRRVRPREESTDDEPESDSETEQVVSTIGSKELADVTPLRRSTAVLATAQSPQTDGSFLSLDQVPPTQVVFESPWRDTQSTNGAQTPPQ